MPKKGSKKLVIKVNDKKNEENSDKKKEEHKIIHEEEHKIINVVEKVPESESVVVNEVKREAERPK